MNALQRIGARIFGIDTKLRAATIGEGAVTVHASTAEHGRPTRREWSTDTAVRDGLKVSTWVYASVRKIASSMASVPLLVERRTADGWEHQPDHPLQALLDQPNGHMGTQDVIERWVQHMMLGGNALWWINYAGGKPVELWPISPDQITPVAHAVDFIAEYEWNLGGGRKIKLGTDAVIHWQFPDPTNPRWGLSPLMAASQAVDLDLAAERFNRATLANDGRPPYAVLLSDKMNAATMKVATSLIRDQADSTSAGQALVLGGATRVQPLSLNAAELDFLNSRAFSMRQIAAVFGVPPLLLVMGEGSTYANLDAAKTSLWEDTVVPLLGDLTTGLAGRLFAPFGLKRSEWRIRPDLSNVRSLQANLKTEAEVKKINADTFKLLVDAGVPANMAAQASGVPLADIPGGDEPRQPGLAMPAPTAAKARAPRRERKSEASDLRERLARLGAWEGKVAEKVIELLAEQGKAAVAAYVAGKRPEKAFSPDDWEVLLRAIHTAVAETEGAIAYATMLKAITATGGAGSFDVLAPGVVGWIDDHVGEMVKSIVDTSVEALRAEIAAGVAAGESQDAIAERLSKLQDSWTGYRARRIARTEVAQAFGAAHDQAARQVAADHDVAFVKVWVSTSDNRTRDEHDEMSGETVALNERFSNNALTAPDGVNCRCVTIYRPEEG